MEVNKILKSVKDTDKIGLKPKGRGRWTCVCMHTCKAPHARMDTHTHTWMRINYVKSYVTSGIWAKRFGL